ncbi:MAG: amidohydrolase family protein, partial [Gammaproteobacteria bacterium]
MAADDRTIHDVTHSALAVGVPDGGCDCHTHVFGPAAKFPYWTGRTYTPPDASVAELSKLLRLLGLSRVVIVHPSPYGTDNAVSIDATMAIGLDRARCVAVIDESFTTNELQAMHDKGVRGVRLNLTSTGLNDPAKAWPRFEGVARLVAGFGWHVQTYTTLAVIEALADRLTTLPVPLVVDHFGGLDAAAGLSQPGFPTLL